MKSVAFWSPLPKEGKTTASRFLVDNYGYVRISFADPLRSMLEKLIQSAGYSRREALYYINEAKEQEIEVIGQSFGFLAGKLGECIHPDIWVNIARSKIARLSSPICVDDLQFPNELAMLKSMGFALVKIVRNDPGPDHASDAALNGFNNWDHVISNTGSMEKLCSSVYQIVS